MARGTTLRNIRIDDERWAALSEYAEAHNTDRSALIREWIDEQVMRAPADSGTR